MPNPTQPSSSSQSQHTPLSEVPSDSQQTIRASAARFALQNLVIDTRTAQSAGISLSRKSMPTVILYHWQADDSFVGESTLTQLSQDTSSSASARAVALSKKSQYTDGLDTPEHSVSSTSGQRIATPRSRTLSTYRGSHKNADYTPRMDEEMETSWAEITVDNFFDTFLPESDGVPSAELPDDKVKRIGDVLKRAFEKVTAERDLYPILVRMQLLGMCASQVN